LFALPGGVVVLALVIVVDGLSAGLRQLVASLALLLSHGVGHAGRLVHLELGLGSTAPGPGTALGRLYAGESSS
jgi:hypothetical protein